jgi:hypothetical protein
MQQIPGERVKGWAKGGERIVLISDRNRDGEAFGLNTKELEESNRFRVQTLHA